MRISISKSHRCCILESTNDTDSFLLCRCSANRWLALRLECVGACITTAAALFAISSKGSINPAFGGLSISYALSITGNLNWMVRVAAELENSIVSVERALEFIGVKSEAPLVIEHRRPAKSWPARGQITLKQLEMRYRPELALVLKQLSLEIAPSQKIGVCGRTGSGKSSLMLVLLRLVELSGGSITIDQIDTSTIGLEDLRSRISILPQDPILFSDTVRYNLDPFSK